MKVLFDENLPALLAESVQMLAHDEPYEVHHVIPWLGKGTSDVSWMHAVRQEGGWIVISNDHHIATRPHEIAAWHQHGIIGFILPKAFNQMRFWNKAAFLIRWWETVIDAAKTAKPGDMYFIPPKWTPTALTGKATKRRK